VALTIKRAMTDSGRRLAAASILVLLVASMILPLWSTRMQSPQYRNEEQLHVYVYAGRVVGDLQELATLNQYVGVQLRTDGPELKIAPWGFALLALVAAMALFVPAPRRRSALRVVFALLMVTLLSGGSLLQYRLYEMGHNRGHTPFARIEDFTAPILGSKKIANFTVYTRAEAGGWALLAAFAISGLAAFSEQSSQPQERLG